MSISKIILSFLLFISVEGFAQSSIDILTEQKGVSIRGLSIPNNKVIWASGSKGSIAKSVDGGNQFEWMQVKGYEQRDFRAIHAFDENEAIIVAVASPGIILKTINGGKSWVKVYENVDTAIFLDAIQFKDNNYGVVVGDPINHHIVLLETQNRGDTWNQIPNKFFKSHVKKGESFFASSSTNLCFDFEHLFFVSGGLHSRFWENGHAKEIPMTMGMQSTGANSIAISPNQNTIMIVGGDFSKEQVSEKNIVGLDRYRRPNSEGKHKTKFKYQWLINKSIQSPNGYKSCVQFITDDKIVTCGTSGVDYSNNKGLIWKKITDQSFHVLKVQPGTQNVFFAGAGGRIGRYNYTNP